MDVTSGQRHEMVERQLKRRGIHDKNVLEAMAAVPREKFVPPDMVDSAYYDGPLPIGQGQTISQPYIVALMTEEMELSRSDRVLEIGTGSGYAAAILAYICDEVYTIERNLDLAEKAKKLLKSLGYENIYLLCGDGTLGWPENAPYDAIVVTAGAPDIPDPLVKQLANGGRLVIPVGPSPRLQTLVRIRKTEAGNIKRENLSGVRFVPLIGEAGWKDSDV
jgi:protein-L-isoaspartate(D-aspartate) O-methyltransferase